MGNDRANSNSVRRDLRVAPQHPSSLYSTSHSSGRPLVPGPRVIPRDRPGPGRLSPPSSFSADQQSNNTKPSSRKTKLIIALGLTLPVLACIIGIVAWAMTTDIVRVSPQPARTRFTAIGSRDKSREKDSFQPRSDQDFDLLLLPKLGSTVPPKRTDSRSTTTGRTTSVSTPVGGPSVAPNISKATSPATATEILSKLISTNGNRKAPPQFVVFAPVPDDLRVGGSTEATKKDLKIHIDDETDLIAEESSHSDEISRDRPPIGDPRFEKGGQSHLNAEPDRFSEMRDSRAGSQDSFPRLSLDNRQQHPPRNAGHPDFDSPLSHHMMKNRHLQPPEVKLSNSNPSMSFHPNVNHPRNDDFPPRGFPGRQQNQQQYPPRPGLQNQQYPQHHNQFTQQGGDPNEEPFPRKYPQPPLHDSSYNGPHTNNNPGIPINSNFGDHKYDSIHSGPHNAPMGGPYLESTGQHSSGYQSNGAPQYYAPPPQTFHTSTSYGSGNLQNSKSGAPLSTYENIGESTVNQGQAHHHHHHHHHHDPTDGGDTQVAAASSTNDADRFGTLGIGMGAPRGITLQVGGLGGLLPIGALGLVKGLASSLLPIPRLGLNRKIFFGVEVGRGGGLSLG